MSKKRLLAIIVLSATLAATGAIADVTHTPLDAANRSVAIYRVRTVRNERIWENVIDANTGGVTEKEISSSLREFDREDLGNIIALKSVEQELSDAVRIAEKAAEGSALAGGLMKQDGKLNFVVLIANGDRLKEVMLEPPRSASKAQLSTRRRTSEPMSQIAVTAIRVSEITNPTTPRDALLSATASLSRTLSTFPLLPFDGHSNDRFGLRPSQRSRHLGWPLCARSGRSKAAAWARIKVKTVLTRWSSARYSRGGGRDGGGTVMPTPPSASRQCRGSAAVPTLQAF
jgi:uncharacterized membrane protein YkoI